MESVTVLGLLLGLFAVFGGAVLEGLHVGAILQGTAAVIVFGGTLGATLVAYPQEDLRRAVKMLRVIFSKADDDARGLVDEIINVANIARKEGILAVEPLREKLGDPLFRKAIKFVIDGFDPQTVKDIMDSQIDLELDEEEAAARVWEGAGGFAPTVGIIGAVLGLIHVMGNLSDPSKLGEGIAVAFVATVYGVGSANLVFIPFGTKLKRKALLRAAAKEVVRIGVNGIQEGLNPHTLRERLEVYVDEKLRAKAADPAKAAVETAVGTPGA